MYNTDFAAERRLSKLNPHYHELIKSTAFVMMNILDKYKTHFPSYTDHSSLHSLQVIDFCNRLMGGQVEKLNADELYVLLMGCYLHDTGMGISDEDYVQLKEKILSEEYKAAHPHEDIADAIRSFHHEFSAGFIRKYAPLFEIPSKEHIEAIAQVSRGHRKTDLSDSSDYPAHMKMPNGDTVCLPYIASLIRLADELDIARDRMMNHDYENENRNRLHFDGHYAIASMEMTEDKFIFNVDPCSSEIREFIEEEAEKLQEVLCECREVVKQRTVFEITQSKVEFIYH